MFTSFETKGRHDIVLYKTSEFHELGMQSMKAGVNLALFFALLELG